MNHLDCFSVQIVFFLSMLVGCAFPLKWFESKPMATIAVTMRADLKAGSGLYQLKIRKIVLCSGYDKYLVMGEVSKLPPEDTRKGQILEDTVTFWGPNKPVQYFLVLTKEVQQELRGRLNPQANTVIETESAPPAALNQESYSIEDCEVFFIRP